MSRYITSAFIRNPTLFQNTKLSGVGKVPVTCYLEVGGMSNYLKSWRQRQERSQHCNSPLWLSETCSKKKKKTEYNRLEKKGSKVKTRTKTATAEWADGKWSSKTEPIRCSHLGSSCFRRPVSPQPQPKTQMHK